ncbi:hypothetical protein [Nocardioides sp. URHA0032]|uniref:hypothetical protein n=1 Tax=Nocardioides sp. URHA0032 TaxID=1380388 RepID=UPI00048ED260|nr:hypothetical protein [Nocardioides sp. URHA0032]
MSDPNSEFFNEDEKHALRMGALAWSGGRGVEHELYDVAERIVKAKLAARPVRRVCATCGTEWVADVQSCPTCPEVSTPPGATNGE